MLEPSNKLRLAVIGLGGRGKENLGGAFCEDVRAVCDVDENALRRGAARCAEGVRTFTDYRVLLNEMASELDAVFVNTPDHSHFPIVMAALERGLHVYCEKPLGHSVLECRKMAQLAQESGLVTQMGNQMHTTENYRRVVELIQSGGVGKIRAVHVWCGKGWGGTDSRPENTDEIPRNLHWDLWLHGAPDRPYHQRVYHPANWRRWWDFGSGTLGDMGCHYMDLVFWALGLNAPRTVVATGPELRFQTEMAPLGLRIQYKFETPYAESDLLPVTWHDGEMQPEILEESGLPMWPGGVLFVGERGMLMADYTRRLLSPEENFRDYTLPEPWIPASRGHFADFFHAIRTGTHAPCDFAYTGKLTETILLGVVAYRTGVALEWDSESLQVVNHPELQSFLGGAL